MAVAQQRAKGEQQHDRRDHDADEFAGCERAALQGLEPKPAELHLQGRGLHGRSSRDHGLDIGCRQILVLAVQVHDRKGDGPVRADLGRRSRIERSADAADDRETRNGAERRTDGCASRGVRQPAGRAVKHDRVVTRLGAEVARSEQCQCLRGLGTRKRESVREFGTEASAGERRADEYQKPHDHDGPAVPNAPAGDVGHE